MRWFKRNTIQTGPFAGMKEASWKEAICMNDLE